MGQMLTQFWNATGFVSMTYKELIMIALACVFLYLAVKKGYEPYLLIPISFGMLLVNLPNTGIMGDDGLLHYLYMGTKLGIYPPLIFLCVGASTDFGPLIANPKSILLGAAAQFGIFFAFVGAILLKFTGPQSAAIGIIGGLTGLRRYILQASLQRTFWVR